MFVAIVAALSTVLLGFTASLLFRRLESRGQDSREEAKEIADAAKAQAEASRASALHLLAKELPSVDSTEQLIQALEKIALQSSLTKRKEERRDDQPQTLGPVQDLVNSYHRQALNQARVQFWFSVIAASVGFIWVIYSGVNIDAAQLGTVLKIVPGVAVDTVAYLFFRQARETRARAIDLYDRLRTDERQTQAVALVGSIEDGRVRSVVKAQLTLNMAGLQPSPVDPSAFLIQSGEARDIRS